MKKPSPPTPSEHPADLLLPYAEDRIAPPDKAHVEEHLSKCDECTLRVEELLETIVALGQNKQAFCPEPWELHDFAQSGEDPQGVISLHVEDCLICSENLSAWKRAAIEERMPAELWGRLKERLPQSSPKQILPPVPRWWQIFLGDLARFWKAPALAAGVAALLLVVVFYSGDIMPPMVPKAKSLPQKTAFVVFFKDFRDPLPQEQIASLYEALKPSTELNDRYNIVSPVETLEVIKSGKVPSHDRSAMIEGLRKNLNVSRLLIVTVFPSADKFSARIEFIDTIDGKTLQTKTEEKIGQNELAERVRSDALGIMLPPINER